MKTINKISNRIYNSIITNKKQFVFPMFLIVSFILFSFVAQNKGQRNFINGKPDNEDSLKTNQPQVNYKVNKQYDENGNLVGYDSTFTYSYSSDGSNNTIIYILVS